jgi:spore maturation protein CgeB
MRIVALGMSNNCFVITEPCEDLGPFEHLEHLVVVKHQDMAAEISFYLNSPWERDRMANNAYNLVKKRYTMTENLKEAVKQL